MRSNSTNLNKLIINNVSPTKLLFSIWFFTIFMASLAPRSSYSLFVWDRVFTSSGIAYIILGLTAFLIGAFIVNVSWKRKLIIKQPDTQSIDVHKTLALLKVVFPIVTISFFLMLLETVIIVGGVANLIYLMTENWHYVGDVFRETKPFPGARLLYSGVIAVGVFSIFLLFGDFSVKKKDKRKLIFIFLICSLILLINPLLVSSRVYFLTFVVAIIINLMFLLKKKFKIIKFVLVGSLIAIVLWTIQETVRVYSTAQFDRIGDSVLYSFERLSWYFANNLANVNNLVEYHIDYHYGLNQFGTFLELLFINVELNNILPQAYSIQGTWTGLGVPFTDFGWFAIFQLMLFGFISQYIFNKAREGTIFDILIYSFIAAAIIISFQTSLWQTYEFLYNLVLIIIFGKSLKKGGKIYESGNTTKPA
ncbi:O-antigen polymerase [Salisediminibacterium beveridgei]|uniref:Oligosaccharide repeat unit polymerase n=1 Tax=Salisediminibacterium beveridgei TaxID=632773 RepID=A0A1D7QRL8_9BACI|nr:O-antigen polymerase [Salisediminibacterium beveridgei]AOM81654.1 hypothetical protein BBEV_0260 [Salisediminibacterium beveridgei]